ncbi:MAG: hypothetical protein M3Y64_01555 [Gemmatimonadota bacterium]|nr:hypothetical protein [Gemmatimonadota bacterium]
MAETITPDPPTNDDRPTAPTRAHGRLKSGRRESINDRSTPKTLLTAVALHVVVILALVRLVTLGHGLHDWFGLRPSTEKREEQITYVDTPKPAPKPVERKPAIKPRVPVAVQPSTGPVVGVERVVEPTVATTFAGGDSSATKKPRDLGINPALVGIAPANADPRIWAPTGNGLSVARTGKQLLDSAIAYAITSAADSLDSIARVNNPGREPGDWTKRLKNGEKWGWDKTGLRLGKYTVPNALLALLPAGIQKSMSGNPIAFQNANRLAIAREDIQRFGAQAIGEADFRKAVKAQQAKAERTHQARADQRAAEKKEQSGTPPPKSSGGN